MTEIDSTLDPFVEAEIKEISCSAHAPIGRDWNRHLSLANVGRAASLNMTTPQRAVRT